MGDFNVEMTEDTMIWIILPENINKKNNLLRKS